MSGRLPSHEELRREASIGRERQKSYQEQESRLRAQRVHEAELRASREVYEIAENQWAPEIRGAARMGKRIAYISIGNHSTIYGNWRWVPEQEEKAAYLRQLIRCGTRILTEQGYRVRTRTREISSSMDHGWSCGVERTVFLEVRW